MSRYSALARVMGITKSLSPLAFDRGHEKPAEFSEVPPPDDAIGDSPNLPAAPIVAEAETVTAEAGQTDVPATEPEAAEGNVVVQFPALAQVTVVPDTAAPTSLLLLDDGERVGGDLIDEIEGDIALLLASIDGVGERMAKASDDEADDAEGLFDDNDDEPTLTLLSELNRMWEADPQIAASA